MRFEDITITEILDVTTVYLEKNKKVEIQNRKTYGLTLCKSGKTIYVQNGQNFISDCYTILILPQGGYYSLTCYKTGYFPVINFTSSSFITDQLMSFTVNNNDYFIDLFDELRELHDLPGNRLEELKGLYQIFCSLKNESKYRENRVLEIVDYVKQNYWKAELTNTMIAEENNISEVYLRKMFAKELDTSPRQYLLQLRIVNAKKMLEERTFSVAKVAERCGYTNVYHFCRSFKKATGFTPSDYREVSKHTYL